MIPDLLTVYAEIMIPVREWMDLGFATTKSETRTVDHGSELRGDDERQQ